MRTPIFKFLILTFAFLFITLLSKSQVTTQFYCYSNSELFVLPLNATQDCDMARCMFQEYFNSVGRFIDNNIVYCDPPVLITDQYTVVDYPHCGGYSSPGNMVIFYKDVNFQGSNISYGINTMANLDNHNPSPIGRVFKDCQVCNDEISSIKVPPGMKVMCFRDVDYQGDFIVYTYDQPILSTHWNDQISSFIILRADAPPKKGKNGYQSSEQNQTDDFTPVSPKTTVATSTISSIKNYGQGRTINNQFGYVAVTYPLSDANSGKWTFEKVHDNIYRIRNYWTTQYLNVEHSGNFGNYEHAIVNCTFISLDWLSAEWSVEYNGTTGFTIKNVGTGKYLSVSSDNRLYCISANVSSNNFIWNISLSN